MDTFQLFGYDEEAVKLCALRTTRLLYPELDSDFDWDGFRPCYNEILKIVTDDAGILMHPTDVKYWVNRLESGAKDMRYAYLKGIDLSGVNLRKVDFEGANLSGVDLSGANLRHATFVRANLSGVNFQKAKLIQTDLSHSNLKNADLRTARYQRVKIDGADLAGIKMPADPI